MFFKSTAIVAATALLAAAPSAAHMTLGYPPPVFAQNNPFNGGKVLDTYTAPMSGREQFPCRDASVVAALGTDAGTPVDTWAAGETRNITITGGAFHGGGSCQLSLSYDKGTTFKVIESFIGNCPTGNGETSYDVVIPSDAPSGDALFAWTWFNKIGNREMYMNCAVVTISGSSNKRDIEAQKRAVAFDERPNIFVANIDGTSGCQTKESIDVDFPNPGEEVVRNTESPGLYVDESLCSDPDNTGAGTPGPVGDGSGSGSEDGTGSESSSAVAEPEPTTSEAGSAGPTTTEVAATSTEVAATSTSVPGGVFITTTDGASASAAPTETETSPAASATTTDAAADPTTLVTTTKPATNTTGGAIGTATSAAPTATASPGGGSSAGAFAEGTACENEGEWNCIDGSSFQRCASGMWSAVITMAAGTSCEAGVSDTFVMHRKRGGSRIILAH